MLGNRVWATFSFSCTTSWVNCANKHSEAVLKWASQDVYDLIASQLGGCGDGRRHGTFDPINSQNVPCSHAARCAAGRTLYKCLHSAHYRWFYSQLYNQLQSVFTF